jgi:hypothetical protein
MRINLTTPMSDDKERQRRTKAEIDAIEKYTEERMNEEYGRIHTDGSRSGGQPVLKPCPFCGSIDLFVDTVDGSLPPQTGQTVSCEDCTAKASYGDWNTRQPTQSDALQADALDFGNELIFACAGLRHKPIDTEAIFSITWDGFPYDVTIRAALDAAGFEIREKNDE